MQQALSGALRGHTSYAAWSHRHPRRHERPQHGGTARVHVPGRGSRFPGVAQLIPQGRRVPPGESRQLSCNYHIPTGNYNYPQFRKPPHPKHASYPPKYSETARGNKKKG